MVYTLVTATWRAYSVTRLAVLLENKALIDMAESVFTGLST